jgi:CHASE3 domain sensor protein
VAALAMLAANELSYWYTSRYTQESIATMRSQTMLEDLHVRMLNAETGQRGFLLTGRADYLQPYEEAIEPVPQNFLELRRHYFHQAEYLAMLTELELLSAQRLAEMAQTIDLKQKGYSQADLETILEASGRAKMQRMRLITSTLLSLEADQLSASQKSTQTVMLVSRVSIALLSLMCLVAILIYLRKNLRLKMEQLELRRLLALERDQLEIVVRKRTEELTQLARYLQSNREDERSRLARNLHDDLGALLTSAKLDAARIKSRVNQVSPDVVVLLAHLVSNLNSSIALGRKIIESSGLGGYVGNLCAGICR